MITLSHFYRSSLVKCRNNLKSPPNAQKVRIHENKKGSFRNGVNRVFPNVMRFYAEEVYKVLEQDQSIMPN